MFLLTGNFFKQQWQDYEVATGLVQKSQAIHVATFRSVMRKDCLQIFLNINFSTKEITITSTLSALEYYFLPKRNVVNEGMFSIPVLKHQGKLLTAMSIG